MKKYIVIGNPIEHSLSPKLHNFWINKYKLKATYNKIKLNENELEGTVKEVRDNKIDGINVTVPFKKKIIPFVDTLSPLAQQANSVNTIYKKKNKIVGDNTDVEGFEKSLKAINFNPKNKKAFIIGAGGVALSIIVGLKRMGIEKISISNRTKSEPENLKEKYKDLDILDWGKSCDFNIVINATSLGLNKKDKINLDFDKTNPNKVFYDVIYSPKKTNFLQEGQKFGNKISNGMKMFIYQAQLSFNIWHNIMPDVDEEVINFLEK